MGKPRLLPVKAPWMVSPSVSYLRVMATESASDEPTAIAFIGYFALENDQALVRTQTGLQKISSPYRPSSGLRPARGPHQLVKVTFTRAVAARMLPSHSDSDVIDPDDFDFSGVPCRHQSGQSVEAWRQTFQETWIQSGNCPDPGMYEVAQSSWLDEVCRDRAKFRHYLVVGHDVYMEVIAEDWKWASEGAVD